MLSVVDPTLHVDVKAFDYGRGLLVVISAFVEVTVWWGFKPRAIPIWNGSHSNHSLVESIRFL